MPLVQAARNKREWSKIIAVIGICMVAITVLFGMILSAPASLLAGIVGSRRTMSQILQPTLVATGILMIVVALGEFGLIRGLLPELHVGQPPAVGALDTSPRRRYRQAAVMGLWMAATFGIVCTKPLYLALLVYVAVVGNVLYGALALGAYGLGLAASAAVGGLILFPAGRSARLQTWLASRREAFHLIQGFVFAVVGTMSVWFFWLRYAIPPS